eukprot:CAMPEP_0182419390 /NCGR_PEP_ID=MMETSP1167-20130531/3861_1 /TAXON_ID=2988 /ORGANISM="Mallomonas Sp, Strain CCMP3275" /LENGTH=270 /DNA_ID=CAMNT_0024594299 /DNA_START=260 /DNA_END=1072 /DNA_ORIENTATION=+
MVSEPIDSNYGDTQNKVPPLRGEKLGELLDQIKDEQASREEVLYREYPFKNISLPVLSDCNNYYSGKYEDFFWHQNSEQIYVYIPINLEVKKGDVKVDFQARHVSVSINGEEIVYFKCLERIIPDGSFWVFESDSTGQRYIQLDMEKRFRMINWKNLFGDPPEEDVADLESRRSEMLDKLFAANKGMSQLTGAPPETLEDMSSEDLKNINSEINEDPQAVGESEMNIEDLKGFEEMSEKEFASLTRDVNSDSVEKISEESENIIDAEFKS